MGYLPVSVFCMFWHMQSPLLYVTLKERVLSFKCKLNTEKQPVMGRLVIDIYWLFEMRLNAAVLLLRNHN